VKGTRFSEGDQIQYITHSSQRMPLYCTGTQGDGIPPGRVQFGMPHAGDCRLVGCNAVHLADTPGVSENYIASIFRAER
jgi:hypothetical protein